MDAYLARFDRRLDEELDLEPVPLLSVPATCLRVGGLPCRVRRRLWPSRS